MKTARKITASTRFATCKTYGLKAIGDAPGTYEAVVSVFGNVDFGGDRVKAGAFTRTLQEWADSGDPIPVIFAHQWDNLDAHIGQVIEAKQMLPGDPGLPPELASNGGLWTKFSLDTPDDPTTFSGKVASLLDARRMKEFSFAYDVYPGGMERAPDGAMDLTALDVIEVGPCLKGMNPSTALMGAVAGSGLKALSKMLPHAFAAGDATTEAGSPTCILCGLTRNTSAHNAAAGTADGKKEFSFEGSYEDRQEDVFEAVLEWACGNDVGNGGFYCLTICATYDDHVVVAVEGWADPYGVPDETFDIPYTVDEEADEVILGEPVEIDIVATLVPTREPTGAAGRAFKIAGGSLDGGKLRATVRDGDGKTKAKPLGKGDEEPESRTGTDEIDEIRLACDLLELSDS